MCIVWFRSTDKHLFLRWWFRQEKCLHPTINLCRKHGLTPSEHLSCAGSSGTHTDKPDPILNVSVKIASTSGCWNSPVVVCRRYIISTRKQGQNCNMNWWHMEESCCWKRWGKEVLFHVCQMCSFKQTRQVSTGVGEGNLGPNSFELQDAAYCNIPERCPMCLLGPELGRNWEKN